jgi:TPR repeat protein
MPKRMRPVVKLEEEGQEAEGVQEEAGAVLAAQRRRVGEAGDADDAQLLWLNMELQAQAIQGVERARVLGEELLQTKARVAELAAEKAKLAAEFKMRDEALRSITQSKDAVIKSKDAVLQAKDRLLQAKDSELRLLHADVAAAQGEALFQEGRWLYGEQRFSEAAERWGRATLLRHGPSHAHMSAMLIYGRPGVAKDVKRAFELAAAGAALDCVHSKGVLSGCYMKGRGVVPDKARGLALGIESAAAGSCFGQYVVGLCCRSGSCGVAQDEDEAVQLFSLAAAQGNAAAQTSLGKMLHVSQGVVQDYAEAVRLYRLAVAQGHPTAQYNLGYMFEHGQGVAQDYDEAERLYSHAAAQGHAHARKRLRRLFGWCE